MDNTNIVEGELLTPMPKIQSKSVTMNFPDAIKEIIKGKRVRRVSWGSASDYGLLKDGWLTIFTKDAFHTWSVSDGDMEGEDWVIYESN